MYVQANFEIARKLYDLYVRVICVNGMLGKFMLFLLTKPPCFFVSTDRIDDLDIRVKQFFMNCRKAKPEWKEQQYKQIRDVSGCLSTVLSILQ